VLEWRGGGEACPSARAGATSPDVSLVQNSVAESVSVRGEDTYVLIYHS